MSDDESEDDIAPRGHVYESALGYREPGNPNPYDIPGTSEFIKKIPRPFQIVPPNPYDTENLCVSLQSNLSRADIYCLRYQTPDHIMSVITELTPRVLGNIMHDGYSIAGVERTGPIQLVRLGYFMIEYISDIRELKLYKIPENLMQNGFNILHSSPAVAYLSDIQFDRQKSIPGFDRLLSALVKKVFFECRIRQGFAPITFRQCFSLDLYPERELSSPNHGFHSDSVNSHIDVSLFTLTYIIRDPTVVIKGPTLVTKVPYPASSLDDRLGITFAVRNASTIGVDNDILDHSSPDATVRTTHSSDAYHTPPIPVLGIDAAMQPSPFVMHSRGKDIFHSKDAFDELKTKMEDNTESTPRSFIRTWFIRSFPVDYPRPT